MGTLTFLLIITVQFVFVRAKCCYLFNTHRCYDCSGKCTGTHGDQFCRRLSYSSSSNTDGVKNLPWIVGCIFGGFFTLACVTAICFSCIKPTHKKRMVHPTSETERPAIVHMNTNVFNVHPLSPGNRQADLPCSSGHGNITSASQPVMPPNYFSLDHGRPSAPPEYTATNTMKRCSLLPPVPNRTGLGAASLI